MNIQRIIHGCWFGGPAPENIRARIARWKSSHPEWEVKIWDETNIHLEGCPYAQEALKRQDWAYLSDYVRLQALTRFGGVYLDSDVEILKPLDRFLDGCLHVGYMHRSALGTAFIAAPPENVHLQNLLKRYQAFRPDKGINNNAIVTEYFLKMVPDFKLTGLSWNGPDVRVHPCHWFEQPSIDPRGGYTVHLYNRAWDPALEKRPAVQLPLNRFLFVLKRHLRVWLETVRSYYFPFYLRDRYGIRLNRLPPLQTMPMS